VNGQAGEPGTGGLVELIDRLEQLLEASELSEIEVEAGSTAVVLKKPSAVAPVARAPESPATGAGYSTSSGTLGRPDAGEQSDAQPANAVLAPLTGLFYSSPSPGAQAYTSVGATITVGQVIGLIEAMKLFNEIKSDRGGRVVRIYPQDGALVKAKQPLIEVES
jgi:acetyl-CoA carboxylase biotin carboxyl carrier protein